MLNNFVKSKRRSGREYEAQQAGSELSDQPLIRLSNLVKTYQSAAGDLSALKNIDLIIQPGEFVAIRGKSGAGKTTLINMITGVDRITSGQVWVSGMPLHEKHENQLAQWRGRTMGIIYQSFHLMPSLSLLDNVLLPIDFCGLYRNGNSKRRALELLTQVELKDHAHKPPSAISGGQQQRVAIARALANDPPILIADEPTGRLDSMTAESIFQIFLDLSAQGKTIVMVTHDRGLAKRASRTIEIADGRIISDQANSVKQLN
ncbi:MAG: ABC transporter ATP-binding protein [Anaerolineales bacterium]|jgi:putative ABC transport system ATP-binding protein